MATHKLCYACKHFEFDPGEPGYSEYTPGSDAHMSCGKDHWCLDNMGYGGKSLAEHLERAKTCKDFEFSDWVKK
jgi:hypothetical protein